MTRIEETIEVVPPIREILHSPSGIEFGEEIACPHSVENPFRARAPEH
ncbi:hypothetical protein RAJCM14343_5001 [Rhodococcus aetherivorans]|uniref:Uncharacterized protein n=1 Tax=Rhodococcus aetherivorans TaxID=191292 RepID=A0ABQ0YTI2_9NOCA|nr:hypothetical protein RAJCM14343_5001 [Rhodococcus aetherivorans]